MNSLDLIQRLQVLRPNLEPVEQLRLAWLLVVQQIDTDNMSSAELEHQCQRMQLQISATSDQHAAVGDELESLATTAPCEFSPDHLWTLVRAIKVQNQILDLYLGTGEEVHLNSSTC
ncbi:MAG: hypothetical protein R3C53_23310 [Pirellulaceae bacterium]